MRWWISGLVALSVVAACSDGPTQQLVWAKQGVSTSDRDAAVYECERDTRASARSFGVGSYGLDQAQSFFARCMSSKGYFLAAPRAVPMPIGDSAGRQYDKADRVMCMFPNLRAPVNLQANACFQGGGTITGPAT